MSEASPSAHEIILPISREFHERDGFSCEAVWFEDESRVVDISGGLLGPGPNLLVTLPDGEQVLDQSWPTVRYPFTASMMHLILERYNETDSLAFLAKVMDQ